MTAKSSQSCKPAPVKKSLDSKPTLSRSRSAISSPPRVENRAHFEYSREHEVTALPFERVKHTAKKRVRFASMASVTARVASQDDLKNSWYGNEDYSSFETECRRTLAAVRIARAGTQGCDIQDKLNPTEFTTNGLEDFMSPVAKKLRDYRKTCHSHHVLMAQFMQRCRGVLSPESLKQVSEIYSSESSEIAFRRGTM